MHEKTKEENPFRAAHLMKSFPWSECPYKKLKRIVTAMNVSMVKGWSKVDHIVDISVWVG
jgi:hypothetical protein